MDAERVRYIPPGVYRIVWTNGSEPSIAAVGVNEAGGKWFAPCNWVKGVPCYDWALVAGVEGVCSSRDARRVIDSARALSEVPAELLGKLLTGRGDAPYELWPLALAAMAEPRERGVLSALCDYLAELVGPMPEAPQYDTMLREWEWWRNQSGLTVRCKNAIRRALNIGPDNRWLSVAQLAAVPDRRLLDQKNFGEGSLKTIRDWLANQRASAAPAPEPVELAPD